MSSRSATPKLTTTKQTSSATTPLRSNAPSPSPSSSSASAPASLPDLSLLLNLPVQVTTTTSGGAAAGTASTRTIKATLYTYDPSSSIVVLSTPSPDLASSSTTPTPTPGEAWSTKRTYHLLKTSQIVSVQVLSPVPDPAFPPVSTPLPSGPPSSLEHLSRRTRESVTRFERDQARLGPRGLTNESTQRVFDLLAKTLPVRWTEEGEIVVMDEVVVDPRDERWTIKGAKGSKDRIDRVGKVLEGVRARVAATK